MNNQLLETQVMQPQSFSAWTLYYYILEGDTLSLCKKKKKLSENFTSLHWYFMPCLFLEMSTADFVSKMT